MGEPRNPESPVWVRVRVRWRALHGDDGVRRRPLPEGRRKRRLRLGRFARETHVSHVKTDRHEDGHPHHQSFWLWVMCLTGVDYFSTLGYQPSIAFSATGRLTPISTLALIGVTLCAALPVYRYVAKKSFKGQGSIAMLESLLSGWKGKTLVLILLGFAATDFVITKTLSAADGAEHLVGNTYWKQCMPDALQGHRGLFVVTVFLLVLLGGVFLKGIKEAVGLAVVLVSTYMTLSAVILAAGVYYLACHPELVAAWWNHVLTGEWHLATHEAPLGISGSFLVILGTCALLFPKLALGMSGFETGVSVMPLVKGSPSDTEVRPEGRIRNTKKLLTTAAVIMSAYLFVSSVVVSVLVPPEALTHVSADGRYPINENGEEYTKEEVEKLMKDHLLSRPAADGRALAYLAHGEGPYDLGPIFGPAFGSFYDLSAILILWFAGASAMAGLLNLLPQYLPRYGMAPEWVARVRTLVCVLTGINLGVTWYFDADVDAQGGAYATGVLMLMTSAAIASTIIKWRETTDSRSTWRRIPYGFLAITVVFLYTTVQNVIEKPEGIKIASVFIAATVSIGIMSRMWRNKELRAGEIRFGGEDPSQTEFLLRGLIANGPVELVAFRGRRHLEEKKEAVKRAYSLNTAAQLIFVQVVLGDTSDFHGDLVVEIQPGDDEVFLILRGATSVAHALAKLAFEIAAMSSFVPTLRFGWSEGSPLGLAASALLFGEGNIAVLVRDLIARHEPDPNRRPLVAVADEPVTVPAYASA